MLVLLGVVEVVMVVVLFGFVGGVIVVFVVLWIYVCCKYFS